MNINNLVTRIEHIEAQLIQLNNMQQSFASGAADLYKVKDEFVNKASFILNKPSDSALVKKIDKFGRNSRERNPLLRDVPVAKNEDIRQYIFNIGRKFRQVLSYNEFEAYRIPPMQRIIHLPS